MQELQQKKTNITCSPRIYVIFKLRRFKYYVREC